MKIDNELVSQELDKKPFRIVNMETSEENQDITFKVIHDLHPEVEVDILLVTTGADDDENMEMVFKGSDDYTDDEARQVLQEVMDTLIDIIKLAVEPVESDEESDDGEGEGANE